MLCLAGGLAVAQESSGSQTYKDRGFTKTFAIHTTVELRFDTPSSGSKTIEAVGKMSLTFTPHEHPDSFNVRWEHLSLRFGAFDLPFQGSRKLRIEKLHVGPADLNREQSVGSFNRRTKRTKAVHLTLVMTLDPKRQTDLAKLGVSSPIQFTISETGRLDLDTGYLLTRTESIPFQLGALTGTAEGMQFSPCTKGLFPDPPEVWEVVMACPDGEAFVNVCCGTENGQACSESSAFDVANETGPAACIAVSVLDFTPCSLARCPAF
jgi:hypothetical protein